MTSTAKDFHRCLRNLHRFTDGQVTVVEWNSDTFSKLVIDVCPNGGLYEDGLFRFQIELENGEPIVTCLTDIYHPNIDPTDSKQNVCLNILDDWPPSYGLQDCIQGILFLLHNPNLNDPLSPYFDDSENEEEFAKNVRSSLRGEEVDGVTFSSRRRSTEIETKTTERHLQDTFNLENVVADETQEDTICLINLFSDRNQHVTKRLEGAFGEQTQEEAVCLENAFPDRKEEDTLSEASACTDQKQKNTVGLEDESEDRLQENWNCPQNVVALQQQENMTDLGNTFVDVETVVVLADGATVCHVHQAVEKKTLFGGNSSQVSVPCCHLMVHGAPEKAVCLVLVCRHSCQVVIGLHLLRKFIRLVNAAATCVRFSLSHVHRRSGKPSTSHECIASIGGCTQYLLHERPIIYVIKWRK